MIQAIAILKIVTYAFFNIEKKNEFFIPYILYIIFIYFSILYIFLWNENY